MAEVEASFPATGEAVLLEKNVKGEAAGTDGMWLRWTRGEVV